MSTYLSIELRQRLQEVDNEHCAYCQTTQANTGQLMTIDHIIPESKGGLTTFENLCFACRQCNESKGDRVMAQDPFTGEMVRFYHPRQDSWNDHFVWDETRTQLMGLTAIGRATIIGLNINNAVIVFTRQRWVSVGWHPPD